MIGVISHEFLRRIQNGVVDNVDITLSSENHRYQVWVLKCCHNIHFLAHKAQERIGNVWEKNHLKLNDQMCCTCTCLYVSYSMMFYYQ